MWHYQFSHDEEGLRELHSRRVRDLGGGIGGEEREGYRKEGENGKVVSTFVGRRVMRLP